MEQITNFENQNLIPITPQKNIFKILFFIFLGLFLITISCLATVLVIKNKSIAPVEELTTIPSPTAIPTPVPAATTTTPITSAVNTKNWNTYNDESGIGISLKYPQIKDYDLYEQVIAGDSGSMFEIGLYGRKGENNNKLASGKSIDYSVSRGGSFYDFGSYIKEGNTIKYQASTTTWRPIDPRNIKKIYTNPNGVEIVLINDTSKFSPGGEDEPDYNDFTKYGNIGALVNTKSKKYPGLAFTIIKPLMTEAEFIQILDTLTLR